MNYYVERYEHPMIVVRSTKTGTVHEFIVRDDGTLFHDQTRFDLGDAKRTAITYLTHYRDAA
jgi:hypothetical protein